MSLTKSSLYVALIEELAKKLGKNNIDQDPCWPGIDHWLKPKMSKESKSLLLAAKRDRVAREQRAQKLVQEAKRKAAEKKKAPKVFKQVSRKGQPKEQAKTPEPPVAPFRDMRCFLLPAPTRRL